MRDWIDRYLDFVLRVVPGPKNPKHYNEQRILVAVIAQLPFLIPMLIRERIAEAIRKRKTDEKS